eukprot:Lithocolla_globosa_v1_NODE_62_length_7247_cov_17.118503.p1 type:complete len:1467 gc:universal NODE_62_length_7247_cov_17.118503:2368-6768(+)
MIDNTARTTVLAPGEGNRPCALWTDEHVEEMAFPGVFGGHPRPSRPDNMGPITYSQQVRWELRNIDRRVAKCLDNIFFKLRKMHIKYLTSRIQVALRTCFSNTNRPRCVSDILGSNMENLIRMDQGYQILKDLRGSPPYFKKVKQHIFAMCRQLGKPTFFLTLSAADLQWDFLLEMLVQLQHSDWSKKECAEYVQKLNTTKDYHAKCALLRNDPVTCARHFDRMVSVMFHKVLGNETVKPLGEMKDFFYRIEFQQRGTPHAHCLLWIKDAPVIDVQTDEAVIEFVDKYVSCSADDVSRDLVSLNTHKHTKTCRRKKKQRKKTEDGKDTVTTKLNCRFHIPLPPMEHTVILRPFDEDEPGLSTHKKNWQKIQKVLAQMFDDHKKDPLCLDALTFDDFLDRVNLTRSKYLAAVRSSVESPVRLFLKRKPNAIRVHAYNPFLMKTWQANMDLQYVVDMYGCAQYIANYISKGHSGLSKALREACESPEMNNSNYWRQISNKFLKASEVSAQEAVYYLLGLPYRRATRNFVFVNTSEKNKRAVFLKSQAELEKLDKDSLDIESDNLLKRYARRPENWGAMCLAEYAAWWEWESITASSKRKTQDGFTEEGFEVLDEDDYPVDDEEDVVVRDHQNGDPISHNDPPSVETPLSAPNLRRRKVAAILRSVRFNRLNDPENYYRELLMLYHPWRNENKDLTPTTSYLAMFNANKDKVVSEMSKYEPNAAIMDHLAAQADSFEHNHDEDKTPRQSHRRRRKRARTIHPEAYDIVADATTLNLQGPPIMKNSEYNASVASLNKLQRQFFKHVLYWMQHLDKPMYAFLSGGAGTGKTHLTRVIMQMLIRQFQFEAGHDPLLPTVMSVAFSGKAAQLLNGRTIHSAFGINPYDKGYSPLDNSQWNTLNVSYANLRVLVIDEISMVSNNLLATINLRLQQIKGNNKPFGGVHLLLVGDLFQLSPDKRDGGWVFQDLRGISRLGGNFWTENISMFELTEIMRQKDDLSFAQMLNRIREGQVLPQDMAVLESRNRKQKDVSLEVVRLAQENAICNKINRKVFDAATGDKCEIPCIDQCLLDITLQIQSKVDKMLYTETGQLHQTLLFSEDSPADISTNIQRYQTDGLVNGCAGRFRKYEDDLIWWQPDDPLVGVRYRRAKRNLYYDGIPNTWLPFPREKRSFEVDKVRGINITRHQYPFAPASAKTFHKAQGSSYDSVFVVFGGVQEAKAHYYYVALSRVRSLSGLYLSGFDPNEICVDPFVVKEMAFLRKQGFQLSYEQPTSEGAIYLNVDNLRTKQDNVTHDAAFMNVSAVCFAECKVSGLPSVQTILAPFSHDYNLHFLPGTSSSSGGLSLLTHKQLTDVVVTLERRYNIEMARLCYPTGNLVFMYRLPSVAISRLKALLLELREELPGRLVIMGDLNVELSTTDIFQGFHSNQQLPSRFASDDVASCLDVVLSTRTVECHLYPIPYSDHSAVWCLLE